MSQMVWLVGLFLISMPLGIGVLIYMQFVSVIQLFELFGGKGDFGGWFLGPFLSYWVVQPFIFWSSVLFALIPGFNIISAFLFGWWATLDYYQYSYELFAGPTIPSASE